MSFANAPANIFELLSEETEQPKVQPAKSAVQPVKPQQQSQPRSGNTTQPRTENKENRSATQGRSNNNFRGPRTDRPPREFNNDRPPREFNNDRPPREFNNRPREFNNDRAPREVGEGNREQRPRREFNDRKPREDGARLDRRSGTGRGYENKKGGVGKNNWGNAVNDDPTVTRVDDATTPATEAKSAETATETNPTVAPVAETPVQESKVAEEKEEDDGTVAFDDFMKQRKALLPTPPVRQAGEGISDAEKKKWASIALVKEKSVEQKDADVKPKDNAASNPGIDIQIAFNDPPVQRRNFRERDDRRPNANRTKKNPRPPKLDSSAFPALK